MKGLHSWDPSIRSVFPSVTVPSVNTHNTILFTFVYFQRSNKFGLFPLSQQYCNVLNLFWKTSFLKSSFILNVLGFIYLWFLDRVKSLGRRHILSPHHLTVFIWLLFVAWHYPGGRGKSREHSWRVGIM